MYINPSNSRTLNTLSLNAGLLTAASIEVSNSSSVNYAVNRKVNADYFIESNPVLITEGTRGIISTIFIVDDTSARLTVQKPYYVSSSINSTTSTAIDTIKAKWVSSSIINTTNLSNLRVGRKFFRTVDILGDTETLAYHPYRASYTSVVPVTAVAKCKYHISTILPTIINIIEPVSYCKYKVRRDRYINHIPVEENVKLISKDLLLYKDDYLKIDLCVHKQKEQPLYAMETQSLFYM